MSTELRDRILVRLHRLFNAVEADKQILIGVVIRSFIQQLVIESLIFRISEWRDKISVDLGNQADWNKIEDRIEDVIKTILSDIATHQFSPGGLKHVAAVGVVEQIHNRWCGIFPFCR